jgi:aminoglycoside/choline kinase family phosphotransferase
VLPAYDEALLRRELQLFPDWYIAQHRQVTLDDKQQAVLAKVRPDRGAQSAGAQRLCAPRLHGAQPDAAQRPHPPLGVLDFQDAVYGPITYDIASLLRDAFLSWEEDFVIDITVRYWEKARRSGLIGANSASAGAMTSASSTAPSNGWACSAT